jgi:hypothetical protein
MSRAKPISDFDVVAGPPAPPAVLHKPADPLPAAERTPVRGPTHPDPGRLQW